MAIVRTSSASDTAAPAHIGSLGALVPATTFTADVITK